MFSHWTYSEKVWDTRIQWDWFTNDRTKTDVNLLDKEFGHYIIFAFEFSIEVLEHDSNHLYEGEDQSAERHRTRVVTASEMWRKRDSTLHSWTYEGRSISLCLSIDTEPVLSYYTDIF